MAVGEKQSVEDAVRSLKDECDDLEAKIDEFIRQRAEIEVEAEEE